MKYLVALFFTLSFIGFSYGQEDIIGKTNKNEILESSHGSWFKDGYNSYHPEPEILKELKHIFEKNNFQVNVYFGTWCSDSQREIPKLIKLLEQSHFNFKNLNLIGVNTDKDIPDTTEKKEKDLNVFNVPTIIVYQNGKEINRFVEYAQESLEKDLIKIFTKKPYKNSYHD